MSWHLETECNKNSEAIKQLVVHSDITHFSMKQHSFKNAGGSIKNNISTFCQVADQLLQQNSERYVFFY
jgi:virulence-associated protein VapD